MKFVQSQITSFTKSLPPRPLKPFKRYLPSLTVDGQVIETGDAIMISETEDEHSFGTVLKIWCKDNSLELFVKIRWFYKPKDVFCTIPDFIGRKELFDSDHRQVISADAIHCKVKVVSVEAYLQMKKQPGELRFTRAKYLPRENALEPGFLDWKQYCVCRGVMNPEQNCLICRVCQEVYHHECMKVPVETESWVCPKCKVVHYLVEHP